MNQGVGMSEYKWIIEERNLDEWETMTEEGLCNPYTNPESAWIDFRYIVEGSERPSDYRLRALGMPF